MAELTRELPFDIGGPGMEEKRPAETPNEPSTEGMIPGYVEPHQRCISCKHFDGDSQCAKYDAQCDMDGSCPGFEEGEAEEAMEPMAEGFEGEDVS